MHQTGLVGVEGKGFGKAAAAVPMIYRHRIDGDAYRPLGEPIRS
jgi:hypothetical protein